MHNDCKGGGEVAVLTLRDVPPDVYAVLKTEATKSGRSLTAVAREALRAYANEVVVGAVVFVDGGIAQDVEDELQNAPS